MINNKDIKNLSKYKGQKGQTLLFIVVAMTIALSVGINASVRTLSSLSRTSRTDTASRALAAAEGGVERYLAVSAKHLERAADQTNNICPEGEVHKEEIAGVMVKKCKLEFEDPSDSLISQAFVTVERYDPEFYPFELETGQLKEVNLYDEGSGTYYGQTDIDICWNSTNGSEVYYVSYNNSGIQQKGGLKDPTNPPPGGSLYVSSSVFEDADPGSNLGHNDYSACKRVTIGSDIYGLRIRSLGGSSSLAVFSTGDDLPLQGYRIKSEGRLKQEESVVATRVIRVIKTLPYLPSCFECGLYSQGGIVK